MRIGLSLYALALAATVAAFACLALLLVDWVGGATQAGLAASQAWSQALLLLVVFTILLCVARAALNSTDRIAVGAAFFVHGAAAAVIVFGLTAGTSYEHHGWRRAGLVALSFGLSVVVSARAERITSAVVGRTGNVGLALLGTCCVALCSIAPQLIASWAHPWMSLGVLGLGSFCLAWTVVACTGPLTRYASQLTDSVRWAPALAALLVILWASVGSLFGSESAPVPTSAAITRAVAGSLGVKLTLSAAELSDTTTEENVTPFQHVLLITMGGLRADHLSAYGYSRRTSPNLERLAEQSLLFDRAYVTAPDERGALLGLFGASGVEDEQPRLLASLSQAGYRTACLIPDSARRSVVNLAGAFDAQGAQVDGVSPAGQLRALIHAGEGSPTFAWVHLEDRASPSTSNPERYDEGVRQRDVLLGELVDSVRQNTHGNRSTILIAGSTGRAFGEREGRRPETRKLYEESVRVPLVWVSPTLERLIRIHVPVSVPRIAELLTDRERLQQLVNGSESDESSLARQVFARSTGGGVLVAEANHRLICDKSTHCDLYDLSADPLQQRRVSESRPEVFERLVARAMSERAERQRSGKEVPPSGAAPSSDEEFERALQAPVVSKRRSAAEALFLRPRPNLNLIDALREVATRDRDLESRRYAALALTRLGETSRLARELLVSDDRFWRRRAALALAAGHSRAGVSELIAWWRDVESRSPELSRQILDALAKLRSKKAIWALTDSLETSPLRAQVAETLSSIGEKGSRWALALALGREREPALRPRIAAALARLGAKHGLVAPLRRFLGTPTPIANGLELASQRGILKHVGGPATKRDLRRLRSSAGVGELVQFIVPPAGEGEREAGMRLLVRARNLSPRPRSITVGRPRRHWSFTRGSGKRPPRKVPELHPSERVQLVVPGNAGVTDDRGDGWRQRHMALPEDLGIEPGRSEFLVVFAERGLEIESLAVVPMRAELESAESSADATRKSLDSGVQSAD